MTVPATTLARVPDLADTAAWDAFVTRAANGSYLQLSAWDRVKAPNGWRAIRLAAPIADGAVGAQVLVHPAPPSPWSFAYVPRGPIADAWDPGTVGAMTGLLRGGLPGRVGRLSHVRIDPEIEQDGPFDPDGELRRSLQREGWRPAPPVQPDATRLVDLRADEAALWGELRKKWRQYVNRARANGVVVREAGREGIGDYHRIIDETARRVGFIIRTEAAYRSMWDALSADGLVRLLFAHDRKGTPVATLFLIRCGDRVVEPFGGMTLAGAELRANYLLKWESMVRAKAAGSATYDMWGLSTPGIAHFKAGFGGREVRYIGAWDLVFDRLGLAAFEVARSIRIRIAQLRHGIRPAGEAE